MLISPPFLPPRNADDLDAAYIDAAMLNASVNCAGTSVPEGSFPVSLKLGWHGGIHLHAPSAAGAVLPVRAIADGLVVFARQPTTQVETPTHPLNYNPYGDQPAWTDDGMVIIQHTTDIGDGAQATGIVFYSVYLHLSQLRGPAATVASGTNATRAIYRKDEIGSAGRIYAAPDHVHFEIVCDDANLSRLVNRQTGNLALTANGRTDSVYGEIYFHLPSGTPFYASNPGATVVTPTVAASYTSTSDLFVGLRYAGGQGAAANRGDAYLNTYTPNGTRIGGGAAEGEREPEAEYTLYATANTFSAAQPAAMRPAPSAVYEFLRFGRVIDTVHETAIPATIPHWRRVRHENGLAWVNLNNQAAGLVVHVFSDADFPHWRGWRLIHDDTDDDSRCESTLITTLIEETTAADGQLTPSELQQRLGLPDVRKALESTICKFPNELNRDTIDARWGWLQTDADYKLEGDNWTNFRAHVAALTVPSASLPVPLRAANWHFHPRAFIRHFRRCSWLSLKEFVQLIPSHAVRTASNTYWEPIFNGATITENNHPVIRNHRVALLKMMRKYGIGSPMRMACFFGNSIQETTWLGTLAESGGSTLWYAPWYGRGFLQLTNPENYCFYWQWRGRVINSTLKNALVNAYTNIAAVSPASARSNSSLQDNNFLSLTQQILNWRSSIQSATPDNEEQRFAPSDSAGFYWAKNEMAIYADRNHVILRRSVITNQGSKVYYRSLSFWQASAAVNLPSRINSTTYTGLNGFDSRCCAYGVAVAILSETLLPDANGNSNVAYPEGYTPRRPV